MTKNMQAICTDSVQSLREAAAAYRQKDFHLASCIISGISTNDILEVNRNISNIIYNEEGLYNPSKNLLLDSSISRFHKIEALESYALVLEKIKALAEPKKAFYQNDFFPGAKNICVIL